MKALVLAAALVGTVGLSALNMLAIDGRAAASDAKNRTAPSPGNVTRTGWGSSACRVKNPTGSTPADTARTEPARWSKRPVPFGILTPVVRGAASIGSNMLLASGFEVV